MSKIDKLIGKLSEHGYVSFPDDAAGYKDMVEWAYQWLSVEKILDIIDDETEIAQYLIGRGWDNVEKYSQSFGRLNVNDISPIDNCNWRRSDAIDLIEQIVIRDGWDKVYAILEPHKPV